MIRRWQLGFLCSMLLGSAEIHGQVLHSSQVNRDYGLYADQGGAMTAYGFNAALTTSSQHDSSNDWSSILTLDPSVTLGLPTGKPADGLGAGKVTYALENHVERTFGIFTPEFELSYGTSSSVLGSGPTLPYVAVARLAYLQVGTSVALPRNITSARKPSRNSRWVTQRSTPPAARSAKRSPPQPAQAPPKTTASTPLSKSPSRATSPSPASTPAA